MPPPPWRIGRISPLHIYCFNNTPICVLWPYLSYFIFLINSIWQNLSASTPANVEIWAPLLKSLHPQQCFLKGPLPDSWSLTPSFNGTQCYLWGTHMNTSQQVITDWPDFFNNLTQRCFPVIMYEICGLTCDTNAWSIYRLAVFGWKSGLSKKRRKYSYTSCKENV